MKRFVLTGAPGSGKTAILRQLEFDGFGVVEEAATDVIALRQAEGIAEPWMQPGFITRSLICSDCGSFALPDEPNGIQFHDRSVICTASLAVYLGYPVSEGLSRELERVKTEVIFQKACFLYTESWLHHAD